MAHAYFAEGLASVSAGDSVRVNGPEARHAVTVARLRVGERLDLLDGNGTRVPVAVVAVDAAAPDATGPSFTAEALEDARVTPEPAPRILLAQALAKGGRDELAVQAAVELGIDAVVPWQAARSIVKWQGAKAQKQRERWQAIAREASRQSLRARVPEVAAVATTADLTARAAAGARVFVLDPWAQDALSAAALPGAGEVLLVVGPEGGIAEDEVARLRAAGAVPVRLGENVLRTSTAGPVALAVLLTRLGRL